MAFTSTQNQDGTITCVIDTGEPYNFVAWLEANVTNPEDLTDFLAMEQSLVAQNELLISQEKLQVTVNGNVVTKIYQSREDLDLGFVTPISSHPKELLFRQLRATYQHLHNSDLNLESLDNQTLRSLIDSN
jgi:hypothetical protein